jgi:ATP-dependent Clp protease adaptor protein ClpS
MAVSKFAEREVKLAVERLDPDVAGGSDTSGERTKLFNVVLLDDDEHTYDYVIEMLQKLFCVSREQAYRHALEVDAVKRTVVLTCEWEPAVFAVRQIHGYGADWRLPRSEGPMSAVAEPAEE